MSLLELLADDGHFCNNSARGPAIPLQNWLGCIAHSAYSIITGCIHCGHTHLPYCLLAAHHMCYTDSASEPYPRVFIPHKLTIRLAALIQHQQASPCLLRYITIYVRKALDPPKSNTLHQHVPVLAKNASSNKPGHPTMLYAALATNASSNKSGHPRAAVFCTVARVIQMLAPGKQPSLHCYTLTQLSAGTPPTSQAA
jgi:hypothetical protein